MHGEPPCWAPQACASYDGPSPGPPRTFPDPEPAPVSPCPQPEACRTLAPEKDKAAKHCSIQLPDGTACVVLVRAGLSIKEVLAGLCERHGINGAAVDLFLVGGDKVQGCGDRGPFLWGRLPCGRSCRLGSRPICVCLPKRAGSLPPWPVLGLAADSALCSSLCSSSEPCV